ncbi:unnamed protein product [Soboliphyme baturini]|uniref:Peptidase_M14 domain-containing protein n=1 Tax=Soboliphyme baturini TaxID=241478 RepID=A0A183IDW9_9BILA|nr:unnamed protein product [Soboliphyme baturini]
MRRKTQPSSPYTYLSYSKVRSFVQSVRHFRGCYRRPNIGNGAKFVWIDSAIHAREWLSTGASMVIIEKVHAKFSWFILPLANPDGYEFSRNHDRFWRKNRAYCRSDRKGTSNVQCSEVYRGPFAFSEGETAMISQFLKKIKSGLMMYVALHTYGQLWMYPFGWDYNLPIPTNIDDMVRLCRSLHCFNGERYMPFSSQTFDRMLLIVASKLRYRIRNGIHLITALNGIGIRPHELLVMVP